MKLDFQTFIAYHPSSKTVKSVYDVPGGLECECICEVCKKELEAVHREKPVRNWFFRHSEKSNCKGNFESLLHKYAKQIITANNSIIRIENETINYIHSIAEMSIDPYRPDVTLTLSNNEKVYIEVFVSSKVKEIKSDFFTSNKFKSFEIDLSDFANKNNLTDKDEIIKKVLDDFTNRKPLYWPSDSTMIEKKEENLGCIWIIIIGILLFFGFRSRNEYSGRKRK